MWVKMDYNQTKEEKKVVQLRATNRVLTLTTLNCQLTRTPRTNV